MISPTVRFKPRLLTLSAVVCAVITGSGIGSPALRAAEIAETTSPVDRPLQTFDLEGELPPFVAKVPRTEAQQDLVQAAALFADARLNENRGNLSHAMRRYQRTLRYDPDASSAHRSAITLALRLKRYDDAARYAVKIKAPDLIGPTALRRIGRFLVQAGKWPEALKMYQLALQAIGPDRQTPGTVLLWMEIGRLHFINSQYAEAADAFDRVIAAIDSPEKHGLDATTVKLLEGQGGGNYQIFGSAFLQAKRLDAALRAFEKSHHLAANKGLIAYRKAQIALRRGKTKEALEHLHVLFDEKLVAKSGQGAATYELLGRLLKRAGAKDQLLGRLEAMHKAEPDNRVLEDYLAGRYLAADKLGPAEKLNTEILAKRKSPRANLALVDVYRRTNKPEKLLKHLSVFAGGSGSLDIIGHRLDEVASDEGLRGAVLGVALKRLKDKPEQLDHGTALAAALLAMQAKESDKAAKLFDAAIAKKPDAKAQTLLTWGLGLLMAEAEAEAAKIFRRGIDEQALAKDNPAFHFYLAGALEMQGKTDEALAAARTAAKANADNPMFANRVAWVSYHAKRYDEAADAYRAILKKFDDRSEAQVRDLMRQTRMVLSNIAVQQNDPASAAEWLEEALDEFPDDIGIFNDLGYLWVDQNVHLNRSLRMIELAVADQPDNIAYRDSLGWANYRLGRYKDAVIALERAAAGDDPDGEILDHLGAVYLKLNDPGTALKVWRRAVKRYEVEKNPQRVDSVKKKIKEVEDKQN